MARYKIWDKVSNFITADGKIITPDEWIKLYPASKESDVKVVIPGGTVNNTFIDVFDNMVERYQKRGCDFSHCVNDQDYLNAIEAFEDAHKRPAESKISAEERIAAALEFLAINSIDSSMLGE